jgi:predicted NAD-dependent protein-ADP-ribosyltransferase YbiA (DUF1768 family)
MKGLAYGVEKAVHAERKWTATPALPWLCFSQWYGAPFEVDGIRYPTSEHYMMAEKARLFGDAENRARILEAGSPGAAKAVGLKLLGFALMEVRARLEESDASL